MEIINVTLNPNDMGSGNLLSNGNLTVANTATTAIRATHGKTTGKWYWEVKFDAGDSRLPIGISNKSLSLSGFNTGYLSNSWRGYLGQNGAKLPESASYGTAWAVGDIIGVALDLYNGTLEFHKNGVSMGVSHTNVKELGEVFPTLGGTISFSTTITINFGATPFVYEMPKGFYSYDGNQYGSYNKFLIKMEDEYYSLVPDAHSTETAIPQMISDTSPSGRAFASSVRSSTEAAWKAFDGTESFYSAANTVGKAGYLGYEFVNPIAIERYTVRNRENAADTPPKNWTFEGSNDGSSWTILDSRIDQIWGNISEDKDYFVVPDKINNYKMYRLNWTSNNGSITTCINELKMYEKTYPALLTILPNQSEQAFINYGMNVGTEIDLNTLITKVNYPVSENEPLDSGKVFRKEIDTLNKPIKSLKLKTKTNNIGSLGRYHLRAVSGTGSFSNNNLSVSNQRALTVTTDTPISSYKYYFEIICNGTYSTFQLRSASNIVLSSGNRFTGTVGIEVNHFLKKVNYYENGVLKNSASYSSDLIPQVYIYQNEGTITTYNFGSSAFKHFSPNGYPSVEEGYPLFLIYNENTYKRYDGVDDWLVVSAPATSSDYAGNDQQNIPISTWEKLSGDVELCCYTDDPHKTEAKFTIETEPFTLEDELAGQTIKVIEYTDNPNQTESSITLETEPFTLYDELGDEVDILYYTDDPNKTSAELEINANYSPLDELDGDFEVVTWSDSDVPPLLQVEGVPFEQMVLQYSDQEIFGKLQSLILKENSNDSVGKLRVIISFDGGRTWQSNKYGKWLTIDHTNKDVIISHGMSPHDVSKLKEESFKGKGDKIQMGYLIADNIHLADGHTLLHNTKVGVSSPTGTVKFSDVAFYILNTAATIQVEFAGNKLSGEISDEDLGKVQYKVSLNGNSYYPSGGNYTPLMNSPQAININISDRDILFGVYNTLRIDFQDAWGQEDYWETTFIGTYSGIMFMDSNKEFLSNSFGEILKYLDFGVIIAGQTTLEQKVIVKNQFGYRVQNLILEVVKEQLPEGVLIELSRSNFPFVAEDPLLFNRFFNEDEEFEFYVRIVTDLLAPPRPNGTFEIRAKADTV